MTSSFAQALSTALLHFIWQGAAVGLLLWIALFLMRKGSASSRYVVSCCALAVLALLPAITAWVVYQPPATVTLVSMDGAVTVSTAQRTAAELAPPPGFAWLGWLQTWALPVWSLGVLMLSLRLAWGAKQVYVLRRRGTPAEGPVLLAVTSLAARIGLRRRVQVLMSSLADGPTVIGWLRPIILLPSATLLGLTQGQLEAVLAHELAHIRRCDYLVNLLQMMVETLLFYHPVVWWTSSRIRQERELCCDDLAVYSCGDALCYARALTTLERMRVVTPEIAMGSTGGPLRYRILRLVGGGREEHGSSRLAGVLALCLGLACFLMNTHWAHGQQPLEPEQEPSVTVRGYSFTSDPVRQEAERGITVDATGSQVLHRTAAEYPQAALEKNIQGTVAVEVTLDAAGNVEDAHVISGPAELRKAALESALSAHFVNQSAGSTRQIRFTFATPRKRAEATVAEKEMDRQKMEAEAANQRLAELQALATEKSAAEQARTEDSLKSLKAELAKAQHQLAETGPSADQAVLLRKTIEDLEHQLGEAQHRYQEFHPEVRKPQAELEFRYQQLDRAKRDLQETRRPDQIAELQRAVRDLKRKLEAEQKVYQDSHPEIRNLRMELESAALELDRERKLQAEEKAIGDTAERTPVAGRTVTSIKIDGLSDALRNDLLAKLPVHEGETLTAESVERLQAAVAQFDEHLEIRYTLSKTGATEIRILTPGSGGNFILRKK